MPSSLTTTLIQSTILNAISNVLAQIIDQYKNDSPFSLNTLALVQFVTYAIIIVPINIIWQKWLEDQYPGFPSWKTNTNTDSSISLATLPNSSNISSSASAAMIPMNSSTAPRKSLSDDNNTSEVDLLPRKEKKTGPPLFRPRIRKKRSGLYNFTMKFVLDQTVGSVLNIVLFILLINLLKGLSLRRTWDLICEDFKPIMIARLKYRPLVSTLLYTVVPLDRRVVFGSACGVIWGVYLSLYAAV